MDILVCAADELTLVALNVNLRVTNIIAQRIFVEESGSVMVITSLSCIMMSLSLMSV